ncbi:protein of unknown function (plasmid) [Candidatus Methylocalor cossyra]|uniref:Transposase n=1 Tax=Candidatus Methylocalor cossyra TaxID=3108543 RepID=A0ABM9NN72_9GAMM
MISAEQQRIKELERAVRASGGAGCSESQVKWVWAFHITKQEPS